MVTDILQALFAALTVGSIYALVAVGVTLVYSATSIINFAQGEFVMLGGMIMVTLHGQRRWPLLVAIPVTVAITALVAAALMGVSYRPGRSVSLVTVLIITIGASLLISGSALKVWDGDVHRFPPFSGDAPVAFGGATVAPQALWVMATAAVAGTALALFLRFTIHGKAMRACAIDRGAAALLGIRVRRMVGLSFVMSGTLGCVAGIVITPLTMVDYSGGMLLAIKGFAAAMLGGMGNVVGAVIGAFVFSTLEAFSVTFVSSSLKELVTFIVIILVLLFLPRGLMGPRRVEGLDEEDVLGH